MKAYCIGSPVCLHPHVHTQSRTPLPAVRLQSNEGYHVSKVTKAAMGGDFWQCNSQHHVCMQLGHSSQMKATPAVVCYGHIMFPHMIA